MKLLKRILDLPELLKKKSFFLFGSRATGKSSLIRVQFDINAIPYFDLLNTELFLELNANPTSIEKRIEAFDSPTFVVIDEVQKIPSLLNEVHRLIELKGYHFLLTGSSARSLKKQKVNLLAGRAWESNLYPLTSDEIPDFDLERYLRFGGLPAVYLSEYPEEDLHAYVNTYLQEEIQAEALTRSIPAFSRFLKSAAFMSSKMVNFSEIANDTAIPVSTIREYYHILEDTFLGFMLPAWTKTVKRKAISTAKFYLFDIGVRNNLLGIKHIEPSSDLFGQSFEHFIALELRAYLSYRRKKISIHYWQSKSGFEVDFILDNKIAIEVKSAKKIQNKHLKGLKALAEENICKNYYLVSFDEVPQRADQIHCIHWKQFLKRLWLDQLL